MKSYSESAVFNPWHMEVRDFAERVVQAIPNVPGVELRCHEVARVVLNAILWKWPEPVTDGYFAVIDGTYGQVDHSWLEDTRAGMTRVILDTYCVARLPQVQLVSDSLMLARLYEPREHRTDIDWDLVGELFECVQGKISRLAGRAIDYRLTVCDWH